ncbi:sensor histidine kinase [Kribbella sandramycini]|nr:sensor histidine kinase [Kribbella sandramycini]
MTAAVAIGVLATSRPADSRVWIVLGAALVTFLSGILLMRLRPRVALVLLGTVAVGGALLAGVRDSNALVLVLVSLTSVVVVDLRRSGIRVIVAVSIGVVAGFGASAWWFERSGLWFLTQVMWAAILLAFGVNRRQYEIQLERTQREQARAARLEERGRIARDLHDVLAHSLGGLSVQLEVAEGLLTERRDVDGALERVRRSRRLAVQGLAEARNAVAALRSDDVPELAATLRKLAEQHQADHGVAVRLTIDGTPSRREPGATVALLSAAREALTNAGKHAPGQPVDIELRYSGGVRLRVRNAGPTDGAGFGLAGMRERLALVGGTLTAGPDGDDWLVVAEVPDE